jgi:3-methylcrotonyl-CoA carboxylase alpha subunit
MFPVLLVANRGEIAWRIIRTCRRLGIATVAVYTEADAGALHVAMADRARRVESYLSIDSVVAAALAGGAAAIHPGYGFLAENPALPEACAAAGLAFVGPPAAAIRAMGSKIAAKRLMAAAGVPLVPGWPMADQGGDQSDAALAAAADIIGYPLLVKASSGGGGRGMRVVRSPDALAEALTGARREAAAAFGDDTLLLEGLLDHPRHVEVQLFADAFGGVVTLFDRDCSVQRRHQKVIEEAPAPGIPESLRREMAAAAAAAARAVGYVGAGTVEFLLEDGAFFFMEMNTRLQVEHPVTEMITGLDLVEWQLVVAAGGKLPLAQDDIRCRGHAMEARLYAEDPARDFLPAPGKLVHFRPPAETPTLRVETGLRQGDTVSGDYDPLLAKLVAWGEDRDAARVGLARALDGFELAGPATNLGLLAGVAAHPAFAAGAVDTGFIARHRDSLLPPVPPAPPLVLGFAALALLLRHEEAARQLALVSADSHSPWSRLSGWRLLGYGRVDVRLRDGDAWREVAIHLRASSRAVEVDGTVLEMGRVERDGAALAAEIGDQRRRAVVVADGGTLTVLLDGGSWRLAVDDAAAASAAPPAGPGLLAAALPGIVTRVLVAVGDVVARGQTLVVVEAMKMEHSVTAPADGVVAALHVAPGDRVAEGAELLVVEKAP